MTNCGWCLDNRDLVPYCGRCGKGRDEGTTENWTVQESVFVPKDEEGNVAGPGEERRALWTTCWSRPVRITSAPKGHPLYELIPQMASVLNSTDRT